jgi:hypothetical protein
MTTITEWIENYIDPNQIFFAKSSGGGLGDRKTFVFAEGRLHLGNWNKTHKEMISASPALQARINDLLVDASNPLGLSTGTIAKLMAMSPTSKKQNLSLVYRANATPFDLMGRFGKHKVIKDDDFLVSFWNKEPIVYGTQLTKCLEEIDELGYFAGRDVYVSTPLLKTVPLNKVLSGAAESKELSDKELEDIKLRERLHLMPPDEKREAMKELGLVGSSPPRASWASERRRLSSYHHPDSSSRTASEGAFYHSLSLVLEDLSS